jgi:hypothetical protein
MKFGLTLLLIAFAVCARAEEPQDANEAVETIVCVRHGEKPKGGLGQLNCRGLNRALALPGVLLKKFGQPQYIFAPNPSEKIDGTIKYNYVRPLMTIEPTAVRCGLPINTKFGYMDIKGLEHELDQPQYHRATIFLAWEHVLLDDFAKDVIRDHNSTADIRPWRGDDFDTIFILKIHRAGGRVRASFKKDEEGLNNLSESCP